MNSMENCCKELQTRIRNTLSIIDASKTMRWCR